MPQQSVLCVSKLYDALRVCGTVVRVQEVRIIGTATNDTSLLSISIISSAASIARFGKQTETLYQLRQVFDVVMIMCSSCKRRKTYSVRRLYARPSIYLSLV